MAEHDDSDLTADDASLELDSLDLHTDTGADGERGGVLEGLADAVPGEGSGNGEAGGFEDLDAFLSDFEEQQQAQAASALGDGEAAEESPPPAAVEDTPDAAEAVESEAEGGSEPADLTEFEVEEPFPPAEAETPGAPESEMQAEPPLLDETAEITSNREEAVDRTVGHASIQLDLPTESEPEPAPASEPEPVVAAAAAAGATEASWEAAPAPGGAGGGRTWVVAAVLMVIALGVAIGATLVAFGLKGQVGRLAGEVERLQSRPVSAVAPAAHDPRVDEAMRQLEALNERVKELSVIVEGPLSHVRDSNQHELDRLSQQVKLLDARVAKLAAGKPAKVAARRSAAPKVSQAKPAPTTTTVEAPKSSIPAVGGWVINLASYSNDAAATRELTRFHNLGINASRERVSKDGKTWYRIQVTGFSSREQADNYARQVKAKAGLKQVWVTQE